MVGLGNPGERYARTRHNVGFEVANELARRWGLPRAKKKYAGLYTDGRTGPGGPRVGVLLPQTYMNDAGRSAGPARGALGVDLDRVLAIHDEIDLPFGRSRPALGGGLAGHNGLKSLKRELGSPDFRRIRVGVGRPDSTDPEIVSSHVLGRFAEDRDEVARLVDAAADEAERAMWVIRSADPGSTAQWVRSALVRPGCGPILIPVSASAASTPRSTRRSSRLRERPASPAVQWKTSPRRSMTACSATRSCSCPRWSRTASSTRAPTTRSGCGSGSGAAA